MLKITAEKPKPKPLQHRRLDYPLKSWSLDVIWYTEGCLVSERAAEMQVPLHGISCRGWGHMLLLRRAQALWRKGHIDREDAPAQAVLKAVWTNNFSKWALTLRGGKSCITWMPGIFLILAMGTDALSLSALENYWKNFLSFKSWNRLLGIIVGSPSSDLKLDSLG